MKGACPWDPVSLKSLRHLLWYLAAWLGHLVHLGVERTLLADHSLQRGAPPFFALENLDETRRSGRPDANVLENQSSALACGGKQARTPASIWPPVPSALFFYSTST
jgi:hypothetical protein